MIRPSTKAPKTAARAPSSTGPDWRVGELLDRLRSDPKLIPVVRAYEENASATGARKFGSNGLKINGKLFVLFIQGTLVVKLPKDRVAELVECKIGKPFDPGHGRLMKQWLTVTNGAASWIELTREAHKFVSSKER